MADISIEEALKLPVKPKKPKPLSIDEALAAPVVSPPSVPAPPQAPGFLENLKIGGQRALLTAADAGRVMEEALGAASRGDFGPIGQLIEQVGRGAAPIVSGLAAGPQAAPAAFVTESALQAPRVAEITQAREQRMAADPTLFSREAQAERARLDELAGRDPSLAGKITRRATEGVLTAAPSVIAGAATGGSVPAMAGMAAFQSMNAPEMLIPNVALAATPLPVGKAIAPIVRRIRPGKVAAEAIPPVPPSATAPEIPAISPETPLPGVETRAPFPALAPDAPLNPRQAEAAALNSAIQKLGTDSVDEIAEMIANANRRFNKTITVPGQAKRPITPLERQVSIEDYKRVSALTKAENDALAEVLPERTFAPVNKMLIEGEPTARAISDIPLDEPNAQLDANLRALKAFFDSESAAAETRISAALEGPPLSKAAMSVAGRSASGPRAGAVSPMEVEIGKQLDEIARPSVARNMEPLDVESMRSAAQPALIDAAPRKPLLKALKIVADIYNIPRSMMSSMDISFPFRQGAIFLVPPTRWKSSGRAMVEMFRAMIPDKPTSIKGGIKAQFAPKTERYQRMVDTLGSDLDAQTGMGSGLKLTSQTGGFLRGKEEVFGSNLAGRLPGVRESGQAYTMGADYTRLNMFKLYKQTLDKRAAQEGWSADQIKDGYRRAAKWINEGSGVGSFGERADKVFDALSFAFFSPRFVASRIQVLNPLTYLRNATTPQGREVLKMQMSEMAQFTAMVGATLFLAKQAGFKVGTNPDKPDFLRLSLGNYHYDGLAGLQPIMRLVWNVTNDAERAARGEKPEESKTALDVGARFLRSKAAPVPSFFVDYFDRKTFEGKPFNLSEAAAERVMPLMWKDFIEAYQREGLGGPLALSPGGIGFGAQYYEPKPIDAAIEQRPALLNELTRIQVRIADPRKRPSESDKAYKERSQAVADLYGRFGVSLMSDRDYANLPETEKRDVFDLLHSRILDAVNTRDRRTGQFQASQLINSLRKSARQKTIRERLISRRPPL